MSGTLNENEATAPNEQEDGKGRARNGFNIDRQGNKGRGSDNGRGKRNSGRGGGRGRGRGRSNGNWQQNAAAPRNFPGSGAQNRRAPRNQRIEPHIAHDFTATVDLECVWIEDDHLVMDTAFSSRHTLRILDSVLRYNLVNGWRRRGDDRYLASLIRGFAQVSHRLGQAVQEFNEDMREDLRGETYMPRASLNAVPPPTRLRRDVPPAGKSKGRDQPQQAPRKKRARLANTTTADEGNNDENQYVSPVEAILQQEEGTTVNNS